MATQVPVAVVPPGIYIGPTGQALVVTQQAGATYTFALADAGTVVESTNATGATFTIPLNSTVGFGVPTEITALDGPGSGVLTVTGAAGVTLNGVSGGSVATTGAYQAITLIQTAANTWVGTTGSASGLSNPVTVPEGGTGATTVAGAQQALGMFRSSPNVIDYTQVIYHTEFQSGHGFAFNGNGAGSSLNDTTAANLIIGAQCVTLTTDGAGGTMRLQQTGLTAFDTTTAQIALLFKCDNAAHLSKIIVQLFNQSGFTTGYSLQINNSSNLFASNEWQLITLSLANFTLTGTPTRSGITVVRFEVVDDNTGNVVTTHFGGFYVIPNAAAQPGAPFPSGVVSITFDDSWSSQFNVAKPVMDAAGVQGTLFTILSVLGTTNCLTLANLQTFSADGWEVASHAAAAANHTLGDTNLTSDELMWDSRVLQGFMAAHGFAFATAGGYAYPQSLVNVSVAEILDQFFGYARMDPALLEVFPPGDLFRCKAYSSIGGYTGANAASLFTTATTGWIAQAVANASWLVLNFHNLVPTPTSVTMSGNTATIVFPSAHGISNIGSNSLVLAGFTPSGLNGTYTTANWSVTNTTTLSVNIGSNPGNGTVMGGITSQTLDCAQIDFQAIVTAVAGSGATVLPMGSVVQRALNYGLEAGPPAL